MTEILFPEHKTSTSKTFEQLIIDFCNSENKLLDVKTSTILKIFDQLSRQWQQKESTLFSLFSENNFGFLVNWLKESNLKNVLNLSLGDLSVLDLPTKIHSRNLIAIPKGILVHWISGNVPLLGVISLFQGLITKNKNIVKVPSSNKFILSKILKDIGAKEFVADDEIISGKQFTDNIMVVYIDKEDMESQSLLSLKADLRVAWGGREAIENISKFNRKIDSEDLIMGPKTSLAVIAKDYLQRDKSVDEITGRIVRDVFNLDQLGCNSPHNFFIEKDSVVSINNFVQILSQKFSQESKRRKVFERAPMDTFNILSERVLYSVSEGKDVVIGDDFKYTIFIDYNDSSPSTPLFHRCIFLKIVNDIYQVPKKFPTELQTVGLAIPENRLDKFVRIALRHGVLRFANIGFMSMYEVPWDGILPLNRMVKWISVPKNLDIKV